MHATYKVTHIKLKLHKPTNLLNSHPSIFLKTYRKFHECQEKRLSTETEGTELAFIRFLSSTRNCTRGFMSNLNVSLPYTYKVNVKANF